VIAKVVMARKHNLKVKLHNHVLSASAIP